MSLENNNLHSTEYWQTIEAAAQQGLPPKTERAIKPTLNALMPLYESGGQFFALVYLNTKTLVYNDPQEKPRQWKTIVQKSYVRRPRQTDGKRGKRYYDWAVRTGKWQMPQRDPFWILATFEVDNWWTVPQHIKAILQRYPTFVNQTGRGFHFYFYVPKWFSKSGSNLNGVDWLARGKIAVLTGHDRQVLHSLPIAKLPEDEARILYDFATTVETTEDSPHRVTRYPDEFEAFEGERNTRINGELYRLRRLSNDETTALALKLAAECSPPYPAKEALAIAKSINRYKDRFPLSGKPFIHPPDLPAYSGNTAYERLGMFVSKAGQPFTRRHYERYLHKTGAWALDKQGHIAAAYHDLKANLQSGEIIKIGVQRSGKRGGRPQHVYRRTRDFKGRPTLPGKPTARLLRLGHLLQILPNELTAITRELLCARLGVKDVGTISRYARLLKDASRWGEPLIEKQEQPPEITTWALLPAHLKKVGRLPRDLFYYLWDNFVRFRPSLYRRLPYYYEVTRQGLFPALQASLERGLKNMVDQLRHHQQTAEHQRKADMLAKIATYSPNDQREAIKVFHLIEQKRQQDGLKRLATPSPIHLEIIANPKRGYTPCDNVAILSKTPSPHDTTTSLRENERLMEVEKPPPEVPQWPFEDADTDEHDDLTHPHLHREADPLPEDQLPGYPINRYVVRTQTLFEWMDEYYTREDIPPRVFHTKFSPEEIAVWQAYTFKEVACRGCNQVEYIHPSDSPQVMCDACLLEQAKSYPLPDTAKAVLARYQTNPVEYLLKLFEATFGITPRTKKEVREAIDTYSWQWVEMAIRSTACNRLVRYPWPTVMGTLRNWLKQGYINPHNQREVWEKRLEQQLAAQGQPLSARLYLVYHDSLYEAFDRYVDFLTDDIAYRLTAWEKMYGERAVRYAIAQADRYHVHHWKYCWQVLERLKWQGKLGTV